MSARSVLGSVSDVVFPAFAAVVEDRVSVSRSFAGVNVLVIVDVAVEFVAITPPSSFVVVIVVVIVDCFTSSSFPPLGVPIASFSVDDDFVVVACVVVVTDAGAVSVTIIVIVFISS